jgi:hypothetical protein
MKSLIVDVDRLPLTMVQIDEAMGAHLIRTAAIAFQFLDRQNPRLWSEASASHFLEVLRRGARRLEAYGRSPDTRLLINGRRLGDSLSVIRAVAQLQPLSIGNKISFKVSLEWVGAIFPCAIEIQKLPPWKDVRKKKSADPRSQQAYEILRQTTTSRTCRKPKVAEASLLFEALAVDQRSSAVEKLRSELEVHTQAYRDAQRHLMI